MGRTNLKPSNYFRFVDDVWGTLTHWPDALDEFLGCANSIHPRIRIEMRTSDVAIEFLDVTIRLENGFLKTDLYRKPNDKHLHLHKRSDHSDTTRDAMPFGLGTRVKRICLEEKQLIRYAGTRYQYIFKIGAIGRKG